MWKEEYRFMPSQTKPQMCNMLNVKISLGQGAYHELTKITQALLLYPETSSTSAVWKTSSRAVNREIVLFILVMEICFHGPMNMFLLGTAFVVWAH